MEVSVTKTTSGYNVKIGDKTVTLPLDSEMKKLKNRGIKIGVSGNWLEIDTYANEIDHTTAEGDPAQSILSEDDANDEQREDIVLKLTAAWSARDEEQDGGRSRVNRKTRRSKGKRGNTKRAKLRNLSSRRR